MGRKSEASASHWFGACYDMKLSNSLGIAAEKTHHTNMTSPDFSPLLMWHLSETPCSGECHLHESLAVDKSDALSEVKPLVNLEGIHFNPD